MEATAEELGAIKFDADGLVPAIAQDVDGTVLMLAWMNADTLRMTFEEGRMVYWSRSRQEVWRKGDTSGDVQEVQAAHYDCDGDVLLFTVVQHGESRRLPHRCAFLLQPPVRGTWCGSGPVGTTSCRWPAPTRSSRSGASCWATWRPPLPPTP